MNLLEKGLSRLAAKQKTHVSSVVSYKSGSKTFEINAVLGRTKYEITDEYGFKIAAHSIDFLIHAAQLDLTPQVGDQIIANSFIYEVLELGGECWRWCDPHRITKRIHTKQI